MKPQTAKQAFPNAVRQGKSSSTEFRHDWTTDKAYSTKALMPLVKQVWNAALQVNGDEKLWKQISRESIKVARCTVKRLMRRMDYAASSVARSCAPLPATSRRLAR